MSDIFSCLDPEVEKKVMVARPLEQDKGRWRLRKVS